MMTFLTYVCQQLLGPPKRREDDGQWYWPCPQCEHPSFHTLPHKPPYKDRFKCFRCGFRGDEHDLINFTDPGTDYGERKAWLAEWQKEYQKEATMVIPAAPIAPSTTSVPVPPSSLISEEYLAWLGKHEAATRSYRAGMVWASLTDTERAAVLVIHEALLRQGGNGKGVPFEALVDYCLNFQTFIDETNAHHLDNCGDDDCSADVCRSRSRVDKVEGSVSHNMNGVH